VDKINIVLDNVQYSKLQRKTNTGVCFQAGWKITDSHLIGYNWVW